MNARKKTGRDARRLAGRLLLLVALLAPAAAAAGEVEFYATPDKDEVAVDDTLTLTVTVALDAASGEAEDLRLPEPDPTAFEVLSRSQSQQMSFAMGSGGPPTFRKVRVFTLLLQPSRTGTFTVRPGRLSFRGKTYETGALRIKVVGAGQGPRRPARRPPPPAAPPSPMNPFGALGGLGGLLGGEDDPDAQQMLEEFFGASRPASDTDLYLRAYVDKRRPFLGEQVTFSFYLFSRVSISGVDGFKMPKLDGFWAEDLETPTQITGESKMIDGVMYQVYLLRRRALFPIKSGPLTIDPVEVDISTGFGLIPNRKVHRSSQAITLEVQPLPAGAPPGFQTPNVGQWRLSAEASPTTTPLGQPITLKVTLEGQGNLHDVVAPRLPALPGFKTYDPTVAEKVSTARGRFGGRRVLEYLLMPEQTGTFEIPALALSYFDPAAGEYREAATQAIPVRVEVGSGAPAAGHGPAVASAGPDHTNLIGGGLHTLRYKAELVRPAPPVWRRPFFLPLALLPLVLWLGLAGVGLVRSTLAPSAEGVQRGLAGKARRRLRTARALLKAKKPDAFYAEISRAFADYLAARLGAPVAGLTRPDLGARLAAAGVGPELVARLGATLDTCDAGRFGPGGSSTGSMERVLAEATAVMAALEGARFSAAAPEVSPS